MPSPFPGMDPYLENPELWPNAHARMIADVQEVLNETIQPKYVAWIESRIYLSNEDDPGRRVLIPDARVSVNPEYSKSLLPPGPSGAGTAVLDVAQPVEVTVLFEDPITESQIQILERDSRRIVTVIEVLSPTNKIAGSAGRDSYLQKRKELLRSPTQWVEIDLLRSGLPIVTRELYPPCDYTVHVSWVRKRPKALLWPIRLRQRLPMIPIPLLDFDPDLMLDLQHVFTRAFDRSGYRFAINYKSDPTPPLSAEDATWADALLKEKGLR